MDEIKHDGYRLIVRRDGDTVRLFTRRGYDWSDRYPAIAAAAKLWARSFTLDGEATVCGPDGVAVFEALHRRHQATDAMICPSTCWNSVVVPASPDYRGETIENAGSLGVALHWGGTRPRVSLSCDKPP